MQNLDYNPCHLFDDVYRMVLTEDGRWDIYAVNWAGINVPYSRNSKKWKVFRNIREAETYVREELKRPLDSFTFSFIGE